MLKSLKKLFSRYDIYQPSIWWQDFIRYQDIFKNYMYRIKYLKYYLDTKLNSFCLINKPKSILVINFTEIGDSINLTPFLQQLRDEFQEAKIDIFMKKPVNKLFKNLEEINEVIEDNNIRNEYDYAFIVDNKFSSSILAYEANIPIRIGQDYRGNGFLLTHKIKSPEYLGKPLVRYKTLRKDIKKEYQHFIDIFKAIGIKPNYDYKLKLSILKHENVDNFLANKNIDDFLVIHPCGSAPSKNIPKEFFDELISGLDYENILITGSKQDDSYNNKLVQNTKVKNISGEFSLTEMAYLLSKAKLVISVDTGIDHISAALNIPIITIFGHGNSYIWSPYSDKSYPVYDKTLWCIGCKNATCYRDKKYCFSDDVLNQVLEKVEIIKNEK